MQKTIDRAVVEVGRVLLGKERQIRQALCCLISGGHLLIEEEVVLGLELDAEVHREQAVAGREVARAPGRTVTAGAEGLALLAVGSPG